MFRVYSAEFFRNEIPFPTLVENRHRHNKNGRKIGISKILTQYGASGQEKTLQNMRTKTLNYLIPSHGIDDFNSTAEMICQK